MSVPVPDAAAPPIPASRSEPGWHRGQQFVLWVHTGRACVEIDGTTRHHLEAGQGIWLPASDEHRLVEVAENSLAFPLVVPAGENTPPITDVVRFSVPDGWRDWLIQHYLHQIAPVTSFGYTSGELVSLLDTVAPPTRRPPVDAAPTPDLTAPPIPRTDAAERVARELLRNPAAGLTVEQWAVEVCTSARSLQRRFLAETGMTFAAWRTRVRLIAAAEYFAHGLDLAQVAPRIGFDSPGGLSRAIRSASGLTPADFRDRARAGEASPLRRAAANRGRPAIARLTTGLDHTAPAPADVQPVSTTWTAPRVNDFHVLIWIYRGTAGAVVDDEAHELTRGDAIWLPAGRPNRTGSPENSIGLPIGELPAQEAEINSVLRARFPSSWDTYLLHSSVARYTGLRPAGYDPAHILDLFADQLAAARARSLPLPTEPAARDAALSFLRHLSAPSRTGPGPSGASLDAAFRRDVGMSWASWCNTARMRVAADMIERGMTPSSVARRVGYTHLPNFSRAFRRFHGSTPNDHRTR